MVIEAAVPAGRPDNFQELQKILFKQPVSSDLDLEFFWERAFGTGFKTKTAYPAAPTTVKHYFDPQLFPLNHAGTKGYADVDNSTKPPNPSARSVAVTKDTGNPSRNLGTGAN